MSANFIIEVIQGAVAPIDTTGVAVENQAGLLKDNGAGYISRAFRGNMHSEGLRHIPPVSFCPQTNKKMERYLQNIKRKVNRVPYELPGKLEKGIINFAEWYNSHQYRKTLANLTPSDVLSDRREQILQHGKEITAKATQHRRDYNGEPYRAC